MGGAIRLFGAARRGNQNRPILFAGLDVGRSCLRLVKTLIRESQYNLLFASAVIVVTGLLACNSAQPESPTGLPSSPSSTPRTTDRTPNIPATISAAVEATITASARRSGKPSPNPAQKTAPTPDIQALISKAVEAAIAGLPTSTSAPSPAPTPDIQALISKAVDAAIAGLSTASPNSPFPPTLGQPEFPAPTTSPTNSSASSTTPGNSLPPKSAIPVTPRVLTPTPVTSSTPTPTVSLPTPTITPVPPAVSSAIKGTEFDPASVTLSSMGATELITLRTTNLDPGVDGVQVNIQHTEALEVSSPVCTGIFQGATSLPTVRMSGGTLIGCFFLSGNVESTDGAVITFRLTRVGNFSAEQVLTLGLKGGTGTQFSDAGRPIGPGLTDQLMIKP